MVLGVFIAVGIVGIAANVAVDVARRVNLPNVAGTTRARQFFTRRNYRYQRCGSCRRQSQKGRQKTRGWSSP